MSAVPKHKFTIEEYLEFDKNTEAAGSISTAG
jgi:hypothetical protein